MFFLFSTGSWLHVKGVNLCNNLEVNSFSELISLCDPIIFKTAWQSNIFFRLLDSNAVEHILSVKNMMKRGFRVVLNSYQLLLKLGLKGILIIENGYKY